VARVTSSDKYHRNPQTKTSIAVSNL